MNKKLLIFALSILAVFFLTAQTCQWSYAQVSCYDDSDCSTGYVCEEGICTNDSGSDDSTEADDSEADDSEADTDGDGVADSEDACADYDDSEDADLDGVPDGCDICVGYDDNDDADGDGTPDECQDSDNDGVADMYDLCPDEDDSVDDDGNGIPDCIDVQLPADSSESSCSDDDTSNCGEGFACMMEEICYPVCSSVDGCLDGYTCSSDGTTCEVSTESTTDTDGDGLTDAVEADYGTDSTLTDTDADGLSDYDETETYITDPLLEDTDGDGFSDYEEISIETDALDPDDFPIKSESGEDSEYAWIEVGDHTTVTVDGDYYNLRLISVSSDSCTMEIEWVEYDVLIGTTETVDTLELTVSDVDT
ncbi:hypothetical protein COV16_06120, partial [Candidatus Woesearchaeota archaeon CG10_big_fil_rev_8_21_14_0_10_34_8]